MAGGRERHADYSVGVTFEGGRESAAGGVPEAHRARLTTSASAAAAELAGDHIG
jgi:hypothetical protein